MRHPLSEEMENEEIFLGADAIQVVKYHGSYQQVRLSVCAHACLLGGEEGCDTYVP